MLKPERSSNKRLIAANAPQIVQLVSECGPGLDGFETCAATHDGWQLSFEPHLANGRALAVAAELARSFAENPGFNLMAGTQISDRPIAKRSESEQSRSRIIAVANDSDAASLLATLRSIIPCKAAETPGVDAASCSHQILSKIESSKNCFKYRLNTAS
jgi:hypothetical protein